VSDLSENDSAALVQDEPAPLFRFFSADAFETVGIDIIPKSESRKDFD
jgi:hypothetical protein